MENWQDVMYTSMRSARGSTTMKIFTAIYYVSWIFIGNFILLNLFLAVIIDSFANSEVEANSKLEEEINPKTAELKQRKLN